MPHNLWPVGERLEPRFGKLGHEYKQIAFDRNLVNRDSTIDWVTPGHPLFESVREDVLEQVQNDLRQGAVFYDLHRSDAYRLDIYSASVKDGRGNLLHRRLFVVETCLDGTLSIRQPTIFLELSAAPAGSSLPADVTNQSAGLPNREEIEGFLVDKALSDFLQSITDERQTQVETITRHMEISLNAIIDRVQNQFAELYAQFEAGSKESGLEGRLKIMGERMEDLTTRLENRRKELEQERHCTITDIQHLGRSWVLPHPERSSPGVAPMVRDDEIERIAVEAVTRYENERGWEVQSVESENKGFDLISRRPHPEDPQTALEVRFIEVKGRAGVGEVALSENEYKTSQRLKKDYWLYVVYNCSKPHPEVHPVCDPAQLNWKPIVIVEHFRVGPDQIHQFVIIYYLIRATNKKRYEYDAMGKGILLLLVILHKT